MCLNIKYDYMYTKDGRRISRLGDIKENDKVLLISTILT